MPQSFNQILNQVRGLEYDDGEVSPRHIDPESSAQMARNLNQFYRDTSELSSDDRKTLLEISLQHKDIADGYILDIIAL